MFDKIWGKKKQKNPKTNMLISATQQLTPVFYSKPGRADWAQRNHGPAGMQKSDQDFDAAPACTIYIINGLGQSMQSPRKINGFLRHSQVGSR